jgi:hypothetical protein
VLDGFPQVEIERIQWRVGKPPAETGPKGEKPAVAAAPVPAASAAPAGAIDSGYALATVSARVVGARRVDLRAITDMATQFIAALRKNPKLNITAVSMPFALTADDTLTGDIGSERAIAEDAAFSFTVGRKLGL